LQTADLLQYGNVSGYVVPVVWSPMLTIWRKLHVEVDSMDKEALDLNSRFQNNEWSNAYPTLVEVNVPGAGFTTVHHDFGCLLCNLDNRWEGGAFVSPSGGESLIVRNTHTELILWGYPGAILNQWCTVRDDDLYFSDLTAPRQLPQTSVITGNIVTAYRDAYIEITEASDELNPNRIVPWQSNLSGTELQFDHLLVAGVCSTWDLDSATNFWARHFVTCYQSDTDLDVDPDSNENCGVSQNCLAVQAPYPILGLSPLSATNESERVGGTVRAGIHETASSTVYKETIRDVDAYDEAVRFWQVVGHEIGHATLDQAGSKISEEAAHAEGGLMSGGDQLSNITGYHRFTAETLVRMRDVSQW